MHNFKIISAGAFLDISCASFKELVGPRHLFYLYEVQYFGEPLLVNPTSILLDNLEILNLHTRPFIVAKLQNGQVETNEKNTNCMCLSLSIF